MFFYHPDVRRDFSVALSLQGLDLGRCMLATRFAGGYYCVPNGELRFAPSELLI